MGVLVKVVIDGRSRDVYLQLSADVIPVVNKCVQCKNPNGWT
jgi:hypothetical protein